jgi:1,4-dihydroxy-2-naphthoate octaprenyltransferase
MTAPTATANAASAQAWSDDTPPHALLSRHAVAPLIETRVSKVIQGRLADVFQHFWGSEPRLRLELHKDHVKQYHIHKETPDSLEYEFVFEAYGTRNWGQAVEVAQRPHRIDVEVKQGPIAGQTVTTLFKEVAGGVEVTQVNRVWPGSNDLAVKIMGGKLKARLAALAGVHLEQHRHDIEGLERFVDRFSQEHQTHLAEKKTNPVADFLKTTRAITLPIILLPVVGAAAVAARQGHFDGAALALTLLGSAAALLGANLLNDLYDFKGGADQSARTIPGAIETGSGAFTEGRWSLRKGWAITAALALVALLCGVVLAATSSPLVLAFASAGALISYVYVGPPFPLAYKGRGLGELSIFLAFGLLPVAGAVLAHNGALTPQAWAVGALFGLTSTLVLYHHHFLHWQADLAAGKGSPVALLGPRKGAIVGLVLAGLTSAGVAAAVALRLVPVWCAIAALPPLLVVVPHRRILRGDESPPARTKVAAAAFGAMALSGLTLAVTLWL